MAILKESWHLLTKPSSLVLKEGFNDFNRSVIILEPFERGFGSTVGNSIRRVLLSSIVGFAVTSIKVNGVLHEFSVIEGVKEDVVDIIMNIKNLAISKDTSDSCTIRLTSSTPGPVYAASIDIPSGMEIINKDLVICTLNEGSSIDIHMIVESGRGYCSADEMLDAEERDVGSIKLDAMFSPVKRVAYKIEKSRVGQVTDFDRLIMEIDTNGTITPSDALGTAAKIMQEQLSSLISFDINSVDSSSRRDFDIDIDFNVNLLKTIEELELSVRSYNCLKNENIIYVGDLVIRTESDMLKTANFGRKSLNELKDNLRSMGLSFGMKLVNWPPKNLEDLLKIKNKEF
jgi:DNA-directed RNA polymerase subunit alpha